MVYFLQSLPHTQQLCPFSMRTAWTMRAKRPQSDMSKADLMGSRVMPRGVGDFLDTSVAPMPLQSSLYVTSSCCCSAGALPGSMAGG